MKVSVIIPVYNVEKYLPRCIKSVIEQTYENLEIVLVDDGSTDRSGALCDEYATSDSRILVIHKENGGLSSARNTGFEASSGSAVFFLDSDDYLPRNCIATCAALMEQHSADEVILKMKYVSEDTNEELTEDEPYFELFMNSEEAIEQSLYQHYFACSATTRLFKRHVIGDIRFPLGKISEDLATCHLFLANASFIIYANQVGLYYRQQNSSIMHSFNAKRFDALDWALQIESYCRQNYPNIQKAALTRTFNVAIHLLFDIPVTDKNYNSYKNRIMAEVRRTRWDVILNRKSRTSEKLAAVISLFGVKVLRAVWNSKISNRVKKTAV